MMQVNRSNFEIWVIDWLDGKLDQDQASELQHFLEENPDLKEQSDDLGIIRINPSRNTFHKKNRLKKTPADITESQFEYLCAACLENDLCEEQMKDLNDAMSARPERSGSFELMMKMKLVPDKTIFKGKRKLIRLTAVQKITRIAVVSLSAAAISIFAIINFHSKPNISPVSERTAVITSHNNSDEKIQAAVQKPENVSTPLKRNPGRTSSHSIPEKPVLSKNTVNDRLPHQSIAMVERVQTNREIELAPKVQNNKLIASSIVLDMPEDEDGRSRIGKFIAKTFREKILGEDVPQDTPLKAIEIAEAGVSGLNKLLGWEMALDEKNDEYGKPKSVYFSSKILKINAPVKKTEPLP